jgi:hypothetical protein
VGAGASKEFGLPLGTELAASIADRLKITSEGGSIKAAWPDLWDSLAQQHHGERNEYFKAFSLIRHGVQLSNSIDDFLDVHADNQFAKRVGKMAIVKSVLLAEKSSKLFFSQSNIYNKMSVDTFADTWIVKFFRVLGRGVSIQNKSKLFNNVSFIIFNYDRCIEHFLLNATRQLYSLGEAEALSLFPANFFIHPYGVAAPFSKPSNPGVPFGGSPDRHDDYYWLSDNIRTYTERMSNDNEVQIIHDALSNAKKIVFLGFAFHEQNMRLLKPKHQLKEKEVYATAKDMSDADGDVVLREITSFFDDRTQMDMHKKIHLRKDATCGRLFDVYSRSLPD